MTTETKGIEIKNKGILLFGIILLLIGLVASFYMHRLNPGYVPARYDYPYQGIGIVLVLAGIVFVALGFFYSPRRQEPTKQV
jgi:vacuolar-type H+-ATPase subunit I/STV1